MKKEKDTYDRLVETLRDNQPSIGNPQQLMDSVMQRIDSLPQKQSGRRLNRFFTVTGWFSGIAATLLLCLFIKETRTHTPELPAETRNERVIVALSVVFGEGGGWNRRDDAFRSIAQTVWKSKQKREQLHKLVLTTKSNSYENK